jgi:hypothetical protein
VAQDGTCVIDLAGYRIFYGPTPGIYTDVIDIPLTDAGLTCADTGVPNPLGCGNVVTCEYALTNLQPGPTYFVATARRMRVAIAPRSDLPSAATTTFTSRRAERAIRGTMVGGALVVVPVARELSPPLRSAGA